MYYTREQLEELKRRYVVGARLCARVAPDTALNVMNETVWRMTRTLRSAVLLFFGLLTAGAAFGQGATALFPPAIARNGAPLSFARLTFCTTPTTIDSTGVCTTPTTVYQDQTLLTPYGSTIQTDGIGNFPPNLKVTISLWFTPSQNYCYTITTTNMISPSTNPCIPFSISVANGGSPSFVTVTITGSGKFAETTAPAPLVGFDFLWADSTDHRLKVNNNNGTSSDVAILSDNLGSFGSTTSAQLASVLSDPPQPAGRSFGWNKGTCGIYFDDPSIPSGES